MQFDKALELRRRWGDKSCDHPEFEKEYYLGAQTGDYVCTVCGKVFPESEWKSGQQQKDDASEKCP
jgi:hypothetical protein